MNVQQSAARTAGISSNVLGLDPATQAVFCPRFYRHSDRPAGVRPLLRRNPDTALAGMAKLGKLIIRPPTVPSGPPADGIAIAFVFEGSVRNQIALSAADWFGGCRLKARQHGLQKSGVMLGCGACDGIGEPLIF